MPRSIGTKLSAANFNAATSSASLSAPQEFPHAFGAPMTMTYVREADMPWYSAIIGRLIMRVRETWL